MAPNAEIEYARGGLFESAQQEVYNYRDPLAIAPMLPVQRHEHHEGDFMDVGLIPQPMSLPPPWGYATGTAYETFKSAMQPLPRGAAMSRFSNPLVNWVRPTDSSGNLVAGHDPRRARNYASSNPGSFGGSHGMLVPTQSNPTSNGLSGGLLDVASYSLHPTKANPIIRASTLPAIPGKPNVAYEVPVDAADSKTGKHSVWNGELYTREVPGVNYGNYFPTDTDHKSDP